MSQVNTNPKKRLQVQFSDDAWAVIDQVTSDANKDFSVGSITYSDVVNELVMNARIDLKALQAKHTDVKRSLRQIASQDGVDLDAAIKALMDLKSKVSKRSSRHSVQIEEGANG